MVSHPVEMNVRTLDVRYRVAESKIPVNYSSACVASIVALESEPPIDETYGSVAGISINDGAIVPVTGSFAVPDAEYQYWQVRHGHISRSSTSTMLATACGGPLNSFRAGG